MIRHRQNRIAPPKRAMTMAFAVSLSRGDTLGHRQNVLVVDALDVLGKARLLSASQQSSSIISISQPSDYYRRRREAPAIDDMSMGSMPAIATGEVSMSMGEPATTSKPAMMQTTSMPTTRSPTKSTPAKPTTNKPTTRRPTTNKPTMGDPATDASVFSTSQLNSAPCETAEQCQKRHEDMYSRGRINGQFYTSADYPIKGCFIKGDNVYFGAGGTDEEMAEPLDGEAERIMWCPEVTAVPSSSPSLSASPTFAPSISAAPSYSPTISVAPSHAPTISHLPSFSPTWDTGRALKQLETSYASDRSSAGIMFDVQAKNPIMIRGISLNTVNTDDVRILVWTKKGTHIGYESNQQDWVLLVNNTVPGKGLDVPTFISPEIFRPTEILENEVRAFYISCTDGPCQRYLLMRDGDPTYFSNDDLRLSRAGTAKSLGFDGSNYVPRTFSGGVHYDIITAQPTFNPTTEPTLSPTTSPSWAPVPNELLTTRLFETTTRVIDDEKYASYYGTMFYIFARENVVINSLAFNTLRTDDVTVQLYTKYGNCTGYDMDLAGWTLIATETVKGQGLGNPTIIPEGSFQPLIVRRKHQQAFYIATDGPYLRLSAGTEEGNRSDFNSDMILYEGIGKRKGIDGASFSPRVWNGAIQYGVVVIPTDMPTMSPSTSPTESPSNSPTEFSFRLRLHWQRGYYWQDDWSDREMYWCMECESDPCREDDDVYIDTCSDSDRQQFRKVGDTFRPVQDSSLCWTYIGRSNDYLIDAKLVLSGKRHLVLRPCMDSRSGYVEQNFDGFKWDGEVFELHPLGREDQCITQWHHPKEEERLYPEECRVARDEVTNYWETY